MHRISHPTLKGILFGALFLILLLICWSPQGRQAFRTRHSDATVSRSHCRQLSLTKIPFERYRVLPGDKEIREDGRVSPEVSHLAFSSDGRALVSTGYADFTVRVWNLERPSLLTAQRLPARPIGAYFTPGGDSVWGITLMHQAFFTPRAPVETASPEIVPLFGTQAEDDGRYPNPYRHPFTRPNVPHDGKMALFVSF